MRFTRTVRRLLALALDTSLVVEQRQAALNDPRISSVEQSAFIDGLDESTSVVMLELSTRSGVLVWFSEAGTRAQQQAARRNRLYQELFG